MSNHRPGRWWIGALPGLEHLAAGQQVDVLRDAPGASVETGDRWQATRVSERRKVDATNGDPERPSWRIGRATLTDYEAPLVPEFATSFTVLEVAPGWLRFGPRGKAVTRILRQIRGLTDDVVGGAGDLPLPPPTGWGGVDGIEALIHVHGSPDEKRLWNANRVARDRVGRAGSAVSGTFRIHAEESLGAIDRLVVGQDRRDALAAVERAAELAAGAAVAEDAITPDRRREAERAWGMLRLRLAKEAWGPFPERSERRLAEAFRLVRAALVTPWAVSPRQPPLANTEFITMFGLHAYWMDAGRDDLPPMTPVHVEGTWKEGTSIKVLSGDRRGESGLLTQPWDYFPLVRPGEPILSDLPRRADLRRAFIELLPQA